MQVVLEFMAFQITWNGLASRLLGHLTGIAAMQKLDGPKSTWPRVSTVFGVRLRRASAVLGKLGVRMTMSHTKSGTVVSLEQVAKLDDLMALGDVSVHDSSVHGDDSGDGDDAAGLSSPVSSPLNSQAGNHLRKGDDNDDDQIFSGTCTKVEWPSAAR